MDKLYFCWVKGRCAPKKPHQTLESAMTEARRLSEIESLAGYDVYIMETIALVIELQKNKQSKRKTLTLQKI